MSKIISSLIAGVGGLGGLFVQRDADGKAAIAVAPMLCLVGLAVSVGCIAQHDEPFSQCFRTLAGVILGG